MSPHRLRYWLSTHNRLDIFVINSLPKHELINLYLYVDLNAALMWLILDVCHDDVIKWKHFPRYWPFVRGIHLSPMNCPHRGQWRGALMFSLICARINGWINNREAGDLRRHHFYRFGMLTSVTSTWWICDVIYLSIWHTLIIYCKLFTVSCHKCHAFGIAKTSLLSA